MDIMKSHYDLLLYLDKYGLLLDMKKACDKFLEQLTEKTIRRFPPLRYFLEIDVIDLLDKNADAGQQLLDEPLKWREICIDILYSCISACDHDENTILRAQINVILIIKCLPETLASPNPRYYGGLVCFQGILTAVSKPVNCIVYSVWSCPEDCESNEVILHYIPKTSPKCYLCKSILFENSGFRSCGEQVTATLVMKNDLLCKKFKIPEYLFDKLVLGARHNLVGVALKKNHYIWSVESFQPILASSVVTRIPTEVENLYKACGGIPWKFIYCLASSIGINVCPLNCFMHLKINLILSLASVLGSVYTGCSIVHVLAAGYDTGYVESIMSAAAELANGSVYFGNANASVSTALIASTGGVTILPLPLHVYNQKQLSALLSAMESNEVTTENGKVRLKAAVWAHGMDMKKVVLFNNAGVFGTACRGDFGEYNDEIVEFLLQQALECVKIDKEEKRALHDIKVYLDAVAGIYTKLSDVAESLLKSYFLAVRRDRPRGVSVGSMSGLIATCSASARLCQRVEANVDDAVFAIWLHESGSPEPRSAPEEYLKAPENVKKLDKAMSNFKAWLEEFTGNLSDI